MRLSNLHLLVVFALAGLCSASNLRRRVVLPEEETEVANGNDPDSHHRLLRCKKKGQVGYRPGCKNSEEDTVETSADSNSDSGDEPSASVDVDNIPQKKTKAPTKQWKYNQPPPEEPTGVDKYNPVSQAQRKWKKKQEKEKRAAQQQWNKRNRQKELNDSYQAHHLMKRKADMEDMKKNGNQERNAYNKAVKKKKKSTKDKQQKGADDEANRQAKFKKLLKKADDIQDEIDGLTAYPIQRKGLKPDDPRKIRETELLREKNKVLKELHNMDLKTKHNKHMKSLWKQQEKTDLDNLKKEYEPKIQKRDQEIKAWVDKEKDTIQKQTRLIMKKVDVNGQVKEKLHKQLKKKFEMDQMEEDMMMEAFNGGKGTGQSFSAQNPKPASDNSKATQEFSNQLFWHQNGADQLEEDILNAMHVDNGGRI